MKGSYRAEFKITLPEQFDKRSKKSLSLNSASLSTGRFPAYVYFLRWLDEVTLTMTCEIAPVHAKPASLTDVRWSQGSTPRKYATELHVQLVFFLVHTLRQTELTKEGQSRWRLVVPVTALKAAAVEAQQPIRDFLGVIQVRETPSTNGEHLRVAEVKSFPSIPKSMRSIHGDRNGTNFKMWSFLLVCTTCSSFLLWKAPKFGKIAHQHLIFKAMPEIFEIRSPFQFFNCLFPKKLNFGIMKCLEPYLE